MRIIFMGSPDFALPSLDALIAAGHDVCAVYCQPPRRAGRGKSLSPTPVQVRAQSLDIPVRMPASLRDGAVQAEFAALNADIAVVAAYGLILPQAVLDAPRLGCINVHGSILPRWRGAAPVQRAILAGDSETGVTIMAMEAGLDTGAMRATARTSIADKNAGILTDEIAHLGARLLVEVLANPSAFPSIPQPVDGISYAAKIEKAQARLDFTQTAAQVVRQVRAFAPSPGAYFEYGGERFRVLDADVEKKSGIAGQVIDSSLLIACGKDALRPTHIQRAGKSAMSTGDFLRGFAIPVGTSLL